MFKLKMIPNILSGLRVLLTPFFLYLIFRTIHDPNYLATGIIIYGIICGTDFCDGKIARYLKAESRNGMFLDLVADSFFILSSCVCFVFLKVLPIWAPLMMLFKLIEFIITSRLLTSKNTLIFDPVGRFSAVLFYIMPIWPLLLGSNFSLKVFLATTLLTTLLSSFLRIRACFSSCS